MKIRNLLPMLAVITGLALSAFTMAPKISGNKAATEELHWFEYSPSTGTGAYLDEMTRAEAVDETICPDAGTQHCRRGYTDQQLQNGVPIDDDVFADFIAKP